jgi:hypothetical protein
MWGWGGGGGGEGGGSQQITAHSNSYPSFSSSFCPLCIRRGFDKNFASSSAEQIGFVNLELFLKIKFFRTSNCFVVDISVSFEIIGINLRGFNNTFFGKSIILASRDKQTFCHPVLDRVKVTIEFSGI